MTKKDLKNGMILETRNGFKYLYLDEILRGDEAYIYLSSYNDDLTIKNRDFSEFEVVKVYKNKLYPLKYVFIDELLEPIWVRPETPKLSEREKEILKALDVIGFTHMTRDKGGNIFAYSSKPIKYSAVWFFNGTVNLDEMQTINLKRDLFSFVKWEDEEPTNILNLLSVLNQGEKND